jgi:N-acetylmuramic acid 6-phosphate etherase
MSQASDQRTAEFLRVAPQFKLGGLVTESVHPVTANLSETAKANVPAALRLLFDVDADVIATYQALVESGRLPGIAGALRDALKSGGRVVFTGCGSTGRLSIQLNSIWRDFWQKQAARGLDGAAGWEDRAFSAMAGGDFALIKSVEGFEDFTQFGRQQLADIGVGPKDTVFAITEGGETSFVIGTAWEALDRGAKVYFVYNNPDDILVEHVKRSREVIQEPRIEKINLTTGPMSITGSTRMQATTIQLCVLVTVLEMVARDLMAEMEPGGPCSLLSAGVPAEFLAKLTEMHATLCSSALCEYLAELVKLEEKVYRSGHKNNYFADGFGIDVLTDTTERSPTFCTPPFRRCDDTTASESWAFLFVPHEATPQAWNHILKRTPTCIEWSDELVRQLVEGEKADHTIEIVHRIGYADLMKFTVGLDGLRYRQLGAGDSAVAIVGPGERGQLADTGGFFRIQLENSRAAGAAVGLIAVREDGDADTAPAVPGLSVLVNVAAPQTDFLLNGVTRAGIKMLLNALSTCTMVRLGRVMGNTMVWVVPSNLKLIDRSTRYIQRLTGLDYEAACRLLHEVMEYVSPRMLADQAYPPVVGMSVLRARHNLTNEQAEERLVSDLAA